ncbi:MAG: c-type cytochrome [Pirellulaceae bacterium]|nr:c-type cytochrome [Pirellulaceae bacterium]
MTNTMLNHGLQSGARVIVALSVFGVLSIVGCSKPTASFSENLLFLKYQEEQNDGYSDQQQQDIVDAVAALFGTPDEPIFIPVEGRDQLLQMNRVKQAAGPVNSDEYGNGRGLYRQHCVHCHGITGNGRGPTSAFLNPYPRDFTMGKFKFTSTPVGIKPTEADLRKTLMNGIAGTSMPSFALLSEGEVSALIDYVKYLSVRGQVERELMIISPDFVDSEDAEANEQARKEFFSSDLLVSDVLASIVESWNMAESMATPVPERPAKFDRFSPEFDAKELAASVDRGRNLYFSNEAQCVKCHGPAQLGDGQTNDYDDWTKEFFDWKKTEDEMYPKKMETFLALGGLKPRHILPRNLRKGVYRGGRRPVDIFWRIHNGIDGSGMPESNKAALKNDDLWDLVNYVLQLPYEPASRPGVELRTNTKEVR